MLNLDKIPTTPASERVVLLDPKGQAIGSADKYSVHTQDTPLHSAFSIFLFNGAGQMLVQQRAWSKQTWPGIWSNACCGHPMPGETLEAAAQRRLYDELSITEQTLQLALPKFRYRASHLGIVENEICPVFIGYYQGEPTPQPTEVASTDWVNWQDFALAAQAPARSRFAHFSPWSLLEAKELAASDTLLHLFQEIRNDQKIRL